MLTENLINNCIRILPSIQSCVELRAEKFDEITRLITMTKMFDFVLKGANASQLEKDIGSDMFPANEHYFGLVNVSSFVMSMFYH